MTTIDTRTLSVADASFVLRVRLGPMRSWTNCLTDMIRGRPGIAGHRLLPCSLQHDGRAERPRYALKDVMDFIANVLASVPTAGQIPIKPTMLAIDPGKSWSLNKFDKAGTPVATLHGYPHPHRIVSPCYLFGQSPLTN